MEVAPGAGTVLLGKYRVESILGRGGMGLVLKVTHVHLGEELAVKLLLPEGAIQPDVVARFLREAQSVVRLRGEHVARVTDIGMLPEGLPFIVMEYLRGVDLSRELKQRKLLPPSTAVDYVLQACEALAEAHSHGIIHRDIKPANLFLTTRPDGTPLIKVLDFGISKAPIAANSQLTQTEMVMGTPGYMSPEQMKATKDVDARTDIWALGTVLYECLSGRRPFDGESFSAIVLMAGTEPPPPLNPSIPRGLQTAVLRCLEKDRKARFRTVAELVVALAPFARNQREAATIVERTSLLLQRPIRKEEIAPPPDPTPTVTTLSGSAGSGLRPWRRRTLTRGIWLLGLAAALLMATLTISRRLQSSDTDRASIEPGREVGQSTGSSVPPRNTPTGPYPTIVANTSATARDGGPDAVIADAVIADAGAEPPDIPVDAAPADAAPDASSAPSPVPPSTPSRLAPTRPPLQGHSRFGVIVVRVKKTWAQVWIDEQETGTTPVRASVPVGPHKVLLVTDGHRDFVTVTVTGGSESVIERNW